MGIITVIDHELQQAFFLDWSSDIQRVNRTVFTQQNVV